MAIKRSNATRPEANHCSSRVENVTHPTADLVAVVVLVYWTNFRIEQSSNNSKHNGNISSLSPPRPTAKKIPPPFFYLHTHSSTQTWSLRWLALIFSIFYSLHFLFFYLCCVCHIIMNVMVVGRAVGRLLYDCFSLLFSPFSLRAV